MVGIDHSFRCLDRWPTRYESYYKPYYKYYFKPYWGIYMMESLRPFLDGLEEGVIFLDHTRRITAINRAAEQMIGQDYKSVIGEFCPSLFNGTECARACAVREDCSLIPKGNQQTRTLNLTLDRADGTHIVLRMWAILLPAKKSVAHYAIILRDRTHEALLEEDAKERLRLGDMVGRSPAMRELFRSIMQAATSNATVLIQGESGTGKELIAKALHDNSSRSHAPYIRVHCASFSENLLESELFGHAKGAFTGAHNDRVGRFEAAHGGTILLDEIGEISPLTQVKLLRVLQEKEVERVGENKPRKVDVRIITATNRNLTTMVRDGTFREDLYYRLNVLPIQVPPLRNRVGDIPMLVHALLGELALRYGREDIQLSDSTMDLLEGYHWPGNVRELANVLEYALVHAQGKAISIQHVPKELFSTTAIEDNPQPLHGSTSVSASTFPAQPPQKTIGYYRKPEGISEKQYIQRVLEEVGGNKVLAANKLGMSRTTLWKRIKTYGIQT